jgi:hypothetical protein
MKIILRTRCGCTRRVEVEDGTYTFVVPLMADITPLPCRDGDPIQMLAAVKKRKFEDTGYYKKNIPVFLEVL